MKLYLELLKFNLKLVFFYRWGFFISIILDPLLLILYVSLLNSLYANNYSQLILGYSCSQMIWYFGGTIFFYYLVYSNPDKNLSDGVTSGNLNVWLVKPLSIIRNDFIKCISYKLCSFVFEFIPCVLIFALIAYPDFLTVESVLKYAAISALSFIMLYLISFLLGTVAFSWQSANALQLIKLVLINFTAGAFIPIEFLPGVLQVIIKALPFQYLFYVPMQFLLNKQEVQGLMPFAKTLAIQVIWIFCLYFLTKRSFKHMIKKFSAVGG